MRIDHLGPCMCGAPDCLSCGPAQGYTVTRVWDQKRGRFKTVVLDDEDDDSIYPPIEDYDPRDDEPQGHAA